MNVHLLIFSIFFLGACDSMGAWQRTVCVEFVDRNSYAMPGQAIELLKMGINAKPERHVLTSSYKKPRPCVETSGGIFKVNVVRSAELKGESYTYINTEISANTNMTVIPLLRPGTFYGVNGGGTLSERKFKKIEIGLYDAGLPVVCVYDESMFSDTVIELKMTPNIVRCSVGSDSVRANVIRIDKSSKTMTVEGGEVVHTVEQKKFSTDTIRGSNERVTFHITADGLRRK